jgi:hypothetical protein
MADPLSERCQCWNTYCEDMRQYAAHEARTPLTRDKAHADLFSTKASVWGTPYLAMERAADKLAVWGGEAPNREDFAPRIDPP